MRFKTRACARAHTDTHTHRHTDLFAILFGGGGRAYRRGLRNGLQELWFLNLEESKGFKASGVFSHAGKGVQCASVNKVHQSFYDLFLRLRIKIKKTLSCLNKRKAKEQMKC